MTTVKCETNTVLLKMPRNITNTCSYTFLCNVVRQVFSISSNAYISQSINCTLVSDAYDNHQFLLYFLRVKLLYTDIKEKDFILINCFISSGGAFYC